MRERRIFVSEILKRAMAKIEKQQPKERTAVWMVGEQLKDILRREPHLAELVEQDLEQEALSLARSLTRQ